VFKGGKSGAGTSDEKRGTIRRFKARLGSETRNMEKGESPKGRRCNHLGKESCTKPGEIVLQGDQGVRKNRKRRVIRGETQNV